MSSLFVDEGIPLLRGQNVKPYSLDLTNLKYISADTHKKWRKSALLPGDVVIVRVGYPGTACVIPDGLGDLNAASLVIVRPDKQKLDPYYLSYVLNSDWGKANVLGRLVGAAQQVFNTSTAADLEIPAPDLPTQRRIAGILSAYDELIANNQRRIAILEEMARALYREWFVRYNAPGVVMGEDGVPEGWEVKRLGEIADSVRRSVAKGEIEDAVPYLGLEHIPRRALALDAWEYTTELGSSKLEFQKGDILFGKIRPYFHKVSVAPFDGLCSSDTIVIRAKEEEYRALATCCAASDEFVAHATATSNGSKMPRADWKVLKDYTVAVPPLELLERFSAVVTNAIEQMQTLVFQNQNLRRTRDLLLPQLMSGRVELEAIEQ